MNARTCHSKKLFCRALVCAVFALGLQQPNSPAAEATNAPPSSRSLEVFKLISERNIFNANRRLRSAEAPAARPERVVRTESFSYHGAMLYDDILYAFFEGTEPQYAGKVLKPGDFIGGFKILEVELNSVKLENSDGKVELPVMMQMRKRDEEKWQVVSGAAPPSSGSEGSRRESIRAERGADNRRDRGADNSRRDRGGFDRRDRSGGLDNERSSRPAAGAETKPSEESTSSNSPDEILKRMMQRRAQE